MQSQCYVRQITSVPPRILSITQLLGAPKRREETSNNPQHNTVTRHLHTIYLPADLPICPSVRPSIHPSLSIYIYGSTALVEFGSFFSFLIYSQSVGLLAQAISPSQGRYLHTGQHKHRINAHRHPCL
jgi:hypothetical protein